MNREIEITSTMRLLVLLFGLFTALMTLWACINMQMLYAAVGAISFLIVLSPLALVKTYDLYCPWSFVLLTIFFGTTLQALCMSFNWPSADFIDTAMLLGQKPEYFIYPSGIFLLGMVCLTVGYFGFQRVAPARMQIKRGYSRSNMIVILGVSFFIACVGSLAFFRLTGGGESTSISSKRTTIESVSGQSDDFSQYGYLRQASKLAAIVFLVLYSNFLVHNEKLTSTHKVILACAFLLACALPFYASSRSQVLWVVLGALGVSYYLGRGNLMVRLGAYGLGGLALFITMSFLRGAGSTEHTSMSESATNAVKSLVLNRNGLGMAKTAHIINHLPEPLEYRYGSTIFVWLIAPVPRGMYPSKPMVNSGPYLGRTLYGTKVSGVPPGAIGELYWNFHIAGVIFGMALIGRFLRFVYNSFKRCDVDPSIIIPVYLFAFLPIGFAVLGHSVGGGIVMRLVDFCTVAIIVYLSTKRLEFGQQVGAGMPHQPAFSQMR